MVRLLRTIWRLYPRGFRERFGRELERDLELLLTSGGRVSVRMVADALATLGRSWTGALRNAVVPELLMADVVLALRALRRAPGYALAVIAILALALGANTAVFSVTHSVLIKALPYGAPERVYEIEPTPFTIVEDEWRVDPVLAQSPMVEALALYLDGGGANMATSAASQRVRLAQVTDTFFRVLQVEPVLGPGLEGLRGSDVTVLSHELWVRAFEADPGVLGRTLDLNGRPHEVVGVMPADVAFPSAVDLWVPFPAVLDFFGGAVGPGGIALVTEHADLAALQADLERRSAERYSDAGEYGDPRPVTITSLRDTLAGSVRVPLLVLLGIAGLVVLLGCLNLAGLVLSRTSARAAELSVRRALGGGRARLFSQLMAEVLILASIAGVVGLGTASLTTELLVGMLPGEVPGLADAGLAPVVLFFAAGLACGAGILVGMVPSLHGALVDERPGSARAVTDDRSRGRTQALLVTGQVAVAAVLVTAAALLGRSLSKLEAVPFGYDTDHVLTLQVRLPEATYPDTASRGAYLRNALAELRGIPGVRAAGASTMLPRMQQMGIGMRLVPDGLDRTDTPFATWIQVSADYFEAMGIPVLQGPGLDHTASGRWDQVLISEALHRVLYQDRPAVDVAARLSNGRSMIDTRVWGVVGDLHLRSRKGEPSEIMYAALEPSPPNYLSFAVRADGDPTLLAARVREVIADVDPSVPPFGFSTTGQAAAREIAVQRAVAILARLFSLVALTLAALGIYGVVAHAFVRRRRELGIRLVMGAEPQTLVGRAMRLPLLLTGVGLALGLGVSAMAARLVAPLLFEVSERDPASFTIVALTVLAVAALATYVPARRALTVDPVESLRTE